MKHIAIVPGYGIPKDITQDLNYSIYLRIVLNTLYQILVENPEIERLLVIFSGGKTDMLPPYGRSEGGEMKRYFQRLLSHPRHKAMRKRLRLRAESRAISTLENFLNSKAMIEAYAGSDEYELYMFCEATRFARIETLSMKVFPSVSVNHYPIDFDQSDSRFCDPDLLAKKEAMDLQISLLALQDRRLLKSHHKLFAEKLRRLREAGPEQHQEAIHAWWEWAVQNGQFYARHLQRLEDMEP
ncbi:hypothetical protein GF380_04450 [Candidatus Uhrbacteria bacterium]|nr:hypothetical protein [Candidatus Uhrbacteria bacterium]MBD3284311.1 hypothetical protein [Candidatus Uhrbacteria bacterium]